jgi:hypothetical protein
MNRDSWDQPGILIHLLADVTAVFKGHAMLCNRHLYRDRYPFGGYRDGTLCAYMHVAARTVEGKKLVLLQRLLKQVISSADISRRDAQVILDSPSNNTPHKPALPLEPAWKGLSNLACLLVLHVLDMDAALINAGSQNAIQCDAETPPVTGQACKVQTQLYLQSPAQ